MITFRVDQLTPCLKETATGKIYETEIVSFKQKKKLSKFNRRTGWYINWGKFTEEVQVYALVLKGTMDIQGMIAIEYDTVAKAVHLVWGCIAPHNNVWEYGKQEFIGVGGHLLAFAAELSEQHGYEGFIYGEAMDEELYKYYIEKFDALPLPPVDHPYRFMLSKEVTKRIREVYDYEWTNKSL